MNRIKKLRESFGIKQSDFAQRFNVTQGTLSNWERGIHEPDIESLKIMREIFNKTSDYILGLSNDPTPPNQEAEGDGRPRAPQVLLLQRAAERGLPESNLDDILRFARDRYPEYFKKPDGE